MAIARAPLAPVLASWVVRGMLLSPRYASWSITAIALEAGFGDLSHFNRRFRRRYLMTPTDLRGQRGT